MIAFASLIFFLSLVLICLLFALKIREQRTSKRFAPLWREAADAEALHLKELMFAAEVDLKKIPPLLMYWGHVSLHFVVLEFARASRAASRRAHAFADFVSAKRNFQRRQTRSEFLKKMTERKNASQDESISNV